MAVFGSKNKDATKKALDPSISSFNSIVNGTTIKGDVEAISDIRIDGKIVGNLYCKAKLVLGESALIEGDIHCQNADISGTVKGNIKIDELTVLKSTAKVNGDIVTLKLIVDSGAIFTGNCKMGENETDQKPREREKTKGSGVLTEV